MSSSNPSLPMIQRQLQEVRMAFLRLHKALLDSERTQYELSYGRIPSSGAFFQLVIDHEWFSWLRPMSQFIVQVDETLAAKEPMTAEQGTQLLETARHLIQPAEAGTPEEQRYFEAIQRDPNIAILHIELSKLLSMKRA